ncbi:MAG: L-seryl-tRNA(Sec) selenium transferase [Verrucomicrobiaceae bacterium]|nr:L-seryl-tRNA(Sec) selenium transferase [Verrucomicrobiaceae bacterium]
MGKDLSRLPAIEKILQALGGHDRLPRPVVLATVREEIKDLRNNEEDIPPFDEVVQQVNRKLNALSRTRLAAVINGTGVLIHTNLGRSPLPERIAEKLTAIATSYNNLELDLNTGERGKRAGFLEQSLAHLCAAEAATSVNNCASALVIILRHLVREGRHRVIISRSQLVEIGGGFRIPDILLASGATLHEIGTTNKTTLSDYREAISEETAMILKVHQSNFFMGGFVENAQTTELSALAREKGIPFCEDLGSGAVVNTEEFGPVEHEPTPAEIMAQGVDLVCFSGDKLLGGPQAGIIAGRADLIAGIKKEPFYRALRCDKLILSMLEEVTTAYLEGNTDVPLLNMLSTPVETLRDRAENIVSSINDLPAKISVGNSEARIGGGTMPRSAIPSVTLDIEPEKMSLTAIAKRLRFGEVPVMGYTADKLYRIDLRTVFSRQDKDLSEAIRKALSPLLEKQD